MLNKLKPKSEFSRNVLTLMTGTTIAQAIPVAISPILTRIYTPEDFGIFALYMSIVSILSVVVTGNYEHAIMLPKKEEDSLNIVVLSLLISFFVSFIIFLIILFFNTPITNLLGNPDISNWLYFIPLSILLIGIYQSLNYWVNRKKEYKNLATSKVAQSGATAVSNLGMGFSGLGSSGLILGSVIGQSAGTAVLAKLVFKNDRNKISQIKKLKIISLAKKYVDFLKYSTFSSLFNSLSFNLFSILLSKVFSTSILGFYSLIYRILTLPGTLIGSSISQVYFQEATKHKKLYGSNRNIFIATLKKLLLISAVVYLPMYFYIKELIVFVFGDKWYVSAEIAYILIPLMFIRFVSGVLSSTLTTYEKQKSGLLINFILATNIVVLFLIANYLKLNYLGFFQLYAVVTAIFYFLFLIYYYYLAIGKG